jgi:hypothetical protein
LIQVNLSLFTYRKKTIILFSFLETKKRGGDSTSPDDIDINIIDKQQFSEIIIPMPSVLKRRSLFSTDIDPDAIQIDVLGDEKLCGSLILSPEDLRMLVRTKNFFLKIHQKTNSILGFTQFK